MHQLNDLSIEIPLRKCSASNDIEGQVLRREFHLTLSQNDLVILVIMSEYMLISINGYDTFGTTNPNLESRYLLMIKLLGNSISQSFSDPTTPIRETVTIPLNISIVL